MLPFVCKCIPLKERNSEHMAKSTTTIAHLVIGPKTTPSHRNESFSNTDYLPMTYQGGVATVNSSNSGEINDLTTDCYCNTSEPFEAKSDDEYLQPTVIQSKNIDIPKAIIERHSGIISPKRS